MSVADLIPTNISDDFFDREFQVMLEYHIPFLINHQNTSYIMVEPAMALQYRGDLSGLLTAKDLPLEFHWITMRCNGMNSNSEFNETMTSVLVPPLEELKQLQQIWASNNNLNIG